MSTKFLLILQVCSFLSGECKAPVEMPQVYTKWAECIGAGPLRSLELLQAEGYENVNKYRLSVRYGCYEITAL